MASRVRFPRQIRPRTEIAFFSVLWEPPHSHLVTDSFRTSLTVTSFYLAKEREWEFNIFALRPSGARHSVGRILALFRVWAKVYISSWGRLVRFINRLFCR